MSSSRFSGRVSTERDIPHTREGLRMQAVMEDFVRTLGHGVTQSALRTPEHHQQSQTSCFYASLVAIRLAIAHGIAPSERSVITRAEEEGLMSPYGAETGHHFYERQTQFINKILGLDVRFIDPRQDDERVDALTHGLRNGQPLVFGTIRHWLVLDGFKRDQAETSWIGMNPASGRRLEEVGRGLNPAFLAARLIDSGLPTVVVEDTSKHRPRFRPTAPRFQSTQN